MLVKKSPINSAQVLRFRDLRLRVLKLQASISGLPQSTRMAPVLYLQLVIPTKTLASLAFAATSGPAGAPIES